MTKLSQTQKIAEFLKQHPDQRFADDKAFISQVVAEIGAQKGQIISISDQIKWQYKPRSRVYWFATENSDVAVDEKIVEEGTVVPSTMDF